MRKLLIVVLGLGVIGGYGSAIARLAHRGGCGEGRYGYGYGDWRRGGWDRGGWDRNWDRRGPPVEETKPAAAAPAPQPAAPVIPQIIIVQPPVQSAAPAPTIVIQPSGKVEEAAPKAEPPPAQPKPKTE
jgi:hypothetical protein